MKTQFFRYILYSIIASLTCLNLAAGSSSASGGNGPHFCAGIDWQSDNRRYTRSFAANLNVGEPRTVRMIYFLPNDRPYRAEVVQKMKDEIRTAQSFFAEQMQAHGYGEMTFRFETNPQGEPTVHRVDGRHPDSYYLNPTQMFDEIHQVFNQFINIYLIVIDNSGEVVDQDGDKGMGGRLGRSGGFAIVHEEFYRDLAGKLAAHELGHAFGLGHDFRDDAYLTSYGPGLNRLSACSAEFLSVHPYFNPAVPIEAGPSPTIELISSTQFPAGSKSVLVQLKVSDSEGLHQAQLFGNWSEGLIACRGLAGEKDTVVEFEYDGVFKFDGYFKSISDSVAHEINVKVIDTDWNIGYASFGLVKFSPHHIGTLRPGAIVTSVSFSPDGVVAAGLWDGTIKLWDIGTQQNIGTLPGHTKRVTSVAFSRDGTTLASGSHDETVKLWNVATGANFADLRHTARVISVAISSDGVVAAGSWDGTVKLWDAATGANVVSLGVTGGVESVVFSPDGRTLVAGTFAGTVELWDASGLMGVRREALTEIDIPASNLRAAIASALGKPPSAPIVRGHLENLTDLDARDANISNLTGLEFATKLTSLNLGGNNISDISAVVGLTNLIGLELGNNSISDISAVAGLTNLKQLNLAENSLSDISAVAGLTNLEQLNLADNSLSDISAVAGLTKLTSLELGGNNISDISPLVENTGLGSGDEVYILGNPLSYPSIYTHIPVLQERGVEVSFDNRTPQRIRIVSGNDQQGLPGAALKKPFVIEVQDERDDAFEEVPVTFTVASGDGTLSTTSTATNTNGRAESTLTLGPNPGTNTVTVSVAGTQEQQTFTAEGIRIPLAFWIISGDDQEGLLGEALANPFVVEVRDQSGDPLPGVQVAFSVRIGGGMLSATSATTDVNGRAESILTLGPNPGANTVEVGVTGIQEKQSVSAIAELPPIPQDVNRDDVVNILDLVLVASVLGDEGGDLAADVNGDGVVNILDLVLVAGALGNVAAATSANPRALAMLTAKDVGQWLAQAGELGLTDATSQRGVLFLEQLFAALTPKETALLPNYPSPFNPETWIPYQLANGMNVQISIYDISGELVRQLDLGHQRAGHYTERSRAAYWDGRNGIGEHVASGVYFYTLTAGDFTATRKMLIGK